jgi:hypothetical protein
MRAYGGEDVRIHIFLTSALAGDEWSASGSGRFTPGERDPGSQWVGGWVDPRAGLDDVEKRKFLTLPGLVLRPSAVQPVASRCTDYAMPAPHTAHMKAISSSEMLNCKIQMSGEVEMKIASKLLA